MNDLAPLARPSGPIIHARQHAGVRALCGEPPGKPWTQVRGYVTCPACKAVIAERLAARSRTSS
jgi:hypothetical protein